MIAALALQTTAFQMPALKAPTRAMGASMGFKEGDIGVLPPLGVFDPLGLISSRDMQRYEIMEIKHGRAAMMGITGCLVHELLGVDALYPTGGLGGAAPPTIF